MSSYGSVMGTKQSNGLENNLYCSVFHVDTKTEGAFVLSLLRIPLVVIVSVVRIAVFMSLGFIQSSLSLFLSHTVSKVVEFPFRVIKITYRYGRKNMTPVTAQFFFYLQPLTSTCLRNGDLYCLICLYFDISAALPNV